MKQYIVKLDTIIQGRPVSEKDIVSLSDSEAKGYKAAGLISAVEADEPEKPVAAPAPAKKAEK
ncbi:hypothetical protein HGG72_08435 [Ochrobactrum pecoris]|uniref:Uncharacterized protein n=1 Tax=Brucella pecoris TaxID=867683 RepID=A0A5C5CU84_9HYPH|nr:hypothetical protein [Brucella pecoris]MBB4092455.1 hypothetical protein [Brucella pecoris]NKW80366.1 hypothetical protein [Brucella pecoris]TNV14296.1 hypothetical protein FIB18_03390 [Brucella pecoris]